MLLVVSFAECERSKASSFLRKRESTPRTFGNAPPTDWIPAFTGMTAAGESEVNMVKDVIAILVSTPGKLKREIGSMSLQQMKTRPVADKWSVQEVLAHLEDIEEIGMRARVAAMLEGDNPVLPSIDQEKRAEDMKYGRTNPLKSLASFTRQRQANVKWLRKLRPAQLKRTGTHQTVGVISVEELVTEWAFHDLGHLKQILEIKRYALYPRIGGMKAFYKLS